MCIRMAKANSNPVSTLPLFIPLEIVAAGFDPLFNEIVTTIPMLYSKNSKRPSTGPK